MGMRTSWLVASSLLALTACSSGDSSSSFASGGSGGVTVTPAGSAGAGTSTGQGGGGQAGVLTAGVWDDGLNYTFFGDYLALHTNLAGSPGFTQAEYDSSHAEFAQRGARSVVDAALVIDTTGSMGDELSY